MFRRRLAYLTLFLLSMFVGVSGSQAQSVPVVKSFYTDAGQLGLTITNLGYMGSSFNCSLLIPETGELQPSGRYPVYGKTEHLYSGGIWVGAIAGDGSILVSTGSQDHNGVDEADEIREFDVAQDSTDFVKVWSNSQNADNYNIAALATQHMEAFYRDNRNSVGHTPIGLKVRLRALAYDQPYADDFVILDFFVINESGTELRDVYVGWWNDTTVGNFDLTDPCGQTGWNYYDDMNGGWGPAEWVNPDFVVTDDPDIWMMYEHDDDGDEGLAESWIGTRLLGTKPAVADLDTIAPVSYNSWYFRNLPEEDDWYEDPASGEVMPGKYQTLANGAFKAGVVGDVDYTIATDWMGLLSTGPFPYVAPGDTLNVTFAVVCAPDSTSLLSNSKVAQLAYDEGFALPTGPPSPILNFGYQAGNVIMTWAPGDSLHPDTGDPLPADDPLRSPEYHISRSTGRLDFQGYRIFRYQGTEITDDPYEVATMIAQFDIIDGIGFDTGLPPLNEDGLREFVDTGLLAGFPYWYSVVSYTAVDVVAGLPEFQSGFNQNAELVYPGPAPADNAETETIGVYPNPYRAASLFDSRTGELELGRKIWFTGLPARCRIQIFTLAGDLIKTIEHSDETSGQVSWDVLTDYGRTVASGLYIYAVENRDTGHIQRGKLVIVK